MQIIIRLKCMHQDLLSHNLLRKSYVKRFNALPPSTFTSSFIRTLLGD